MTHADTENRDAMTFPDLIARMAGMLPKGRYHFCPNGSHLALYDDQQVYVDGIIRFIQDVDAGR